MLESIGFYTLSDRRARTSSATSHLTRCELLITDRCNFRCPYCRGCKTEYKGDITLEEGLRTLGIWFRESLQNIRFSGGEPTLHPYLIEFVRACRSSGCVKRIAVSTNGSASWSTYQRLLEAGVNDFSVSLDACCASMGDKMAGVPGVFGSVAQTIRRLAKNTYVTAGVVLTPENQHQLKDIVTFASSTLGVADVRIISAAQTNQFLRGALHIPSKILAKHPILQYRVFNLMVNKPLRGLTEGDCTRCYLALDDMAVLGGYHFPCIIYLREGGAPIGKMGPDVRKERAAWVNVHDSLKDPICKGNCLDVCRDFNNKASRLRK